MGLPRLWLTQCVCWGWGAVMRPADPASQAGIVSLRAEPPQVQLRPLPLSCLSRDLTSWHCSAKAAPREPARRAWARPPFSGTPAGPAMEVGDGGGQLSSQQRQTGAGGQGISETSPEWQVRITDLSSPLRLFPHLLKRNCPAMLLGSCSSFICEKGPKSQAISSPSGMGGHRCREAQQLARGHTARRVMTGRQPSRARRSPSSPTRGTSSSGPSQCGG